MFGDVIVFGVGHSGTSLLSKMLHTLGWKRNDADEPFAESVQMRELNSQIIATGFTSEIEAAQRAYFRSLERPFALKDPRFVETLPHWISTVNELKEKPTLLMITRDRQAVAQSYVDRGELVDGQPGTRGHTLPELLDLAAMNYERWPFRKTTLCYERLVEAALIVKQQRKMRPDGGLWL
ncbi:hypothetical protein LVJ94_31800 [Pendulispora rubella]|uniref:Sulfotransferase n=1 Tax=Pendulispora rubella TaxID=2741070 RepID=A0ABZ2KS32_9BACT